jgi:hypothetical protein
MNRFLLALLLATHSVSALAQFDGEPRKPTQRQTFEYECDVGVTLGLYALSRLEMIEVNQLLDKKRQFVELCKTLDDETIAQLFEQGDVELRIRFGGGMVAAEGMGIDEEHRNGKYAEAMRYLIRHRGNCDCENLEEDLENYERLVKSRLPMPSVVDLEAKSREHAARSREYAFVDACRRGREIAHDLFASTVAEKQAKQFNRECVDVYARPDIRKTLDSMESITSLHEKGCKMGAEMDHGEPTTAEGVYKQAIYCQSTSYSERMIAEDTVSRRESLRSRRQPNEEAMWQKLRAPG